MREPLTLSRTASMSGTSSRPSGAKPSSRSEPPLGLATLSEPGSLSRRIALMAGIFLLGIALGWLATRPFVGGASQPVTLSEYTTVVALLYQRDHNANLANERLGLYGTPADLARSAASDPKITSASDQAAVTSLSSALSGTVAATPAASDQSVPSASTSQSAAPTSDRSSWVGPVIAFVVALVLGAIVLLRTAGLSTASLGISSLGLGGLSGGARRSTRPNRADSARSSLFASNLADDLPTSSSERPASSTRSGRPILETRPLDRRPTAGRAVDSRASDSRAVTARGRIPSFSSSYRIGDDPYDEIHPITDPTTGSLIAACGLSTAVKHPGRGSQYFAFTAWLQNYADDERLNAAGLIAPGAEEFAQDQIQSWVRGGQIDAIVPIEKNMQAEIGSGNLSATVTILDAEFGDEPGAPRSYVRKLVVRFDVNA